MTHRWCATNLEALELPLWLSPARCHVLHSRGWRAAPEQPCKTFELRTRALGHQPDGPIGLVAHPAGEIQLARPVPHVAPKPDALHTAGDDRLQTSW